MLLIIQIDRKRKRYILLTVLRVFLDIDFQRSKSGFTLNELPECCQSGIKIVYNYCNEDCVMTLNKMLLIRAPHLLF